MTLPKSLMQSMGSLEMRLYERNRAEGQHENTA
jgi:hypothetical protein